MRAAAPPPAFGALVTLLLVVLFALSAIHATFFQLNVPSAIAQRRKAHCRDASSLNIGGLRPLAAIHGRPAFHCSDTAVYDLITARIGRSQASVGNLHRQCRDSTLDWSGLQVLMQPGAIPASRQTIANL